MTWTTESAKTSADGKGVLLTVGFINKVLVSRGKQKQHQRAAVICTEIKKDWFPSLKRGN